jgi:hypothetical protein
MKCEEFEEMGLERSGQRTSELNAAMRDAAADHVARCPDCAALQESWAETRHALQLLREATAPSGAPLRVEMRLRQEFAAQHRVRKVRAAGMFAAWALASAAALVAGVSWWNWNLAKNHGANSSLSNAIIPNATTATSATSDAADQTILTADNQPGDFTLLPGSLPVEIDDSAVVRVGMQRGALTALGLPVNEERVGDWIQVDLLVGEDGLPKAVRLPQ